LAKPDNTVYMAGNRCINHHDIPGVSTVVFQELPKEDQKIRQGEIRHGDRLPKTTARTQY